MKKQWLTVIERAIHSDQELFPLNQTWQAVHENYNIGLTQGNKLKLSPQDKAELATLVRLKTGLDLNQQTVTDLDKLHREQALSIGAIDEKLAGLAVKRQRLAIKTTSGNTLKINQQSYQLPVTGFLDMALDTLMTVEHSCVLVVENYRCIDRLDKLVLNLQPPYNDPLVVFRGDTVYSENTVRRLLAQLALPTLAMLDVDPKGLVIGQSLPYIVGLVIPKLSDLERMLNDPDKANRELYTKQFAVCRNALAETPYPLIVTLWELLQRHQAGLVQEHWLNERIELSVHLFNITESDVKMR